MDTHPAAHAARAATKLLDLFEDELEHLLGALASHPDTSIGTMALIANAEELVAEELGQIRQTLSTMCRDLKPDQEAPEAP